MDTAEDSAVLDATDERSEVRQPPQSDARSEWLPKPITPPPPPLPPPTPVGANKDERMPPVCGAERGRSTLPRATPVRGEGSSEARDCI